MLKNLREFLGNLLSANTANPSNNPNFVTEPDRIVKLIEAVALSSQQCSVTIKGSKTIFSTTLIDFQPEQNFLILDYLTPIEGNAILQIVKVLKLSAFANNIPLAFNLTIHNHGMKQGIPYYTASLPDRIYYPQRRKAPRIFIDKTSTLRFLTLTTHSDTPVSGVVFDLSRSGLCVNLSPPSIDLARGDSLKNCWIILPDEDTVTFDLAIRSVKTLQGPKTQISGYFINMPPTSKRKLDRHIARLERATIRKLKN